MSEVARLQRDKKRAKNKEDIREVATLCNLLGQELQRTGDFEGALAQHQEEAAMCKILEDTVGTAVAHRRLGEVYSDLGKWDKAIHHQGRHLFLAREAESVVEEQRAHATLGRTYLQMSEELGVKGQEEEKTRALTEAEKSFLRSLSTCERLQGEVDVQEHSQMRCRLYLNLGLVLDNRGNFKKACNFIGQALDLCTGHSMTEDAHRCHAALGGILLREGKIQAALQEGQKAMALSAKLRDKALQCESHSFLAQVHLHNNDYEAAKKSYYKAYKMKHPVLEEKNTIERNLKVVVAMCIAEDALVTLGESDADHKLEHYEKLGDGAAHFGLFPRALSYYNKMLALALLLHKPPSFLAPIYLSLARTYSDNKQFGEAKDNYLLEYEIKIQEDNGEACKTLLNIASVDEELGLGRNSLCATYQQARQLAISAHKPKLEAFILQQQLLVPGLSEEQKLDLEQELSRVIEENSLDPDDVDTVSDEEEAEVEDEVDIDLLHFSDSDDDQENFDRPRQVRQKKLMVKRNEKGETPLHKACIDGNLRMVQKLLQQGHPVNPRDNCGWLPLHEAANHGFVDVVQALLDAGACINDRGGQRCDGVTPLHDAAAAGNFGVVRLLLQRGASVTAKTDEGDTPLESLVKYRHRVDLPPIEQEDCLLLEAQLKEMMKQAGHNIPIVQEDVSGTWSTSAHDAAHTSNTEVRSHTNRRQTAPKSGCGKRQQHKERIDSYSPPDDRRNFTQRKVQGLRSTESKLSRRSVIDEDPVIEEDDDILSYEAPPMCDDDQLDPWPLPYHHAGGGHHSEELPNPLLEQVQEDLSATRSYISAISSVGSSAQWADLQRKAGRDPGGVQAKREALVTEGEDVGDDWLDDDMGIFAKKRKRQGNLPFEYREVRKERKVVETKTPMKSLSRKKPRQVKITSMVHEYDNPRHSPTDTNEVVFMSVEKTSPKTTQASSAASKISPNGASSGASPAVVGGALRLRVRVEDRLLLVPVAGDGQGRTMEWLAEEVSRRYYQLTGLRPKLTLSTQDGADFFPSDPISLALHTEQAELQGQVTEWDLPPLPERYSQACQTMGRACLPSLSSALLQAESSTSLDLSRFMRLTTAVLQPVLRALQHQNNLRNLNLSNSRLGDDGFHSLVQVLPSLPSLEVLELKCSSLTTSSFCELTEAITSGKLSFKKLRSLDLGYNNFSGLKVKNVVTVLTLPCLTVLSLQYCYLTLVEEQAAPFTSCLHILSLDFNTVSSRVLSSLLDNLPQLRTLTLCALKHQKSSGEDGSAGLGRALSVLLGASEQCHLEHLDLSSCQLTNEDLQEVSAYLYRCPNLVSVNLAHNPDLLPYSLTQFLQELRTNLLVSLSSLSLHGNKGVQGLGQEVGDLVRHKGSTGRPLTQLSLTVGHSGIPWLQDLWTTQHQGKAAVNRIQEELFLTIK